MAILRSHGILLVDSIPTHTPTSNQARLARLVNTDTFYYYNNTNWIETKFGNDGNDYAFTRNNNVENIAPTSSEIPNPIIGDTAKIKLDNDKVEFWNFEVTNWVRKFVIFGDEGYISTVTDVNSQPEKIEIATHYDGVSTTTHIFETITSLTVSQNILHYKKEDGTEDTVDLSLYLDDTNLSRLVEGTLDGNTGIATFTRDDGTTFTVDFSALLDDTNTTSVITNVLSPGNRIFTHNDGATPPLVTDIYETITIITDNGDGTFSYTNENGDVITWTDGSNGGSVSTVLDTNSIDLTLSNGELSADLIVADDNIQNNAFKISVDINGVKIKSLILPTYDSHADADNDVNLDTGKNYALTVTNIEGVVSDGTGPIFRKT